MKKNVKSHLILLLILLPSCFFGGGTFVMPTKINSFEDATSIFPKTSADITSRLEALKKRVKKDIDQIIAVPTDQRTFENTMRALDNVGRDISQEGGIFGGVKLVFPAEMQETANNALLELEAFMIDAISQNKDLYKAVKSYADNISHKEKLSPEDQYFLDETLKDFERNGLNLSDEEINEIKHIKKEIAKNTLAFEKAIDDDVRTITVPESELVGLSQDFINALPKKEKDGVVLRTLDSSQPVYIQVMENADLEKTRKAMWREYNNRAYPQNMETLDNILKLRDQLAHKLGFANYASLDLDDQMAKDPKTVSTFITDISKRAITKANQEVKRYLADLPKNVSLDSGKIKPWDWAYIKNAYRKKQFNLDERVIAEYFPVEHTLQELLKLYEDFLDVQLTITPVKGLWHEDVMAIEMRRGDELIGFMFLDLFPRPQKYTHACKATMIPAGKTVDGQRLPGVVLVVANFPKPIANKPALLKFDDVKTFFHEFGHAIHALIGATELSSQAGTNVKTDFVEMPSQMLEEWIWDKNILKQISKHYKTGESLPDKLIDKKVSLKNFDAGDFVQRQLIFAQTSLKFFEGIPQDTTKLMHSIMQNTRPYIAVAADDHTQASFGHLTHYSAKYYGYMWAKVFALDMFDQIKKAGLRNPEMGKKYIDTVLSKGGSRPPQELIKNFLGREPNSDAFFKDLGI